MVEKLEKKIIKLIGGFFTEITEATVEKYLNLETVRDM